MTAMHEREPLVVMAAMQKSKAVVLMTAEQAELEVRMPVPRCRCFV